MWPLPGPGVEPTSPAWTGTPFTTEPPRKPRNALTLCIYPHTHSHTLACSHINGHTCAHTLTLRSTFSHSCIHIHTFTHTQIHSPTPTYSHSSHTLTHTVVCWNQPEPSHERLLLNFQFCEPVTQRSHYKSNNKHIIKQITLQIKLTNTQNSSLPSYLAILYYYLCSQSY